MRLTSLSELNCSIAKTLDVVGEWWTLLILRDAYRGIRRFDEFQASLGLARSVLTARLHKLTDEGILERHQYCDHPARYEYQPTDKGRALFPVIAALMQWGDTWMPGPAGPPTVLVHDTCGHVMHPILTCPHCRGDVTPANTHSEPGPGARRSLRDRGQQRAQVAGLAGGV
jgi:DNA-binding HxlR family transcriptional regulator